MSPLSHFYKTSGTLYESSPIADESLMLGFKIDSQELLRVIRSVLDSQTRPTPPRSIKGITKKVEELVRERGFQPPAFDELADKIQVEANNRGSAGIVDIHSPHSGNTPTFPLSPNHPYFGKEEAMYESSPTTDRTARYIHQVIDFVFQGKVDDALWDLTEYLLQEVAPGKVKRIIQDWCVANEYDTAGEAGSSLRDVQSFIVHTMDEIHGGKTDDAMNTLIDLLLENFSPSLMISIIDKMALSFNDITQEDLEGIKVKAGLSDKVTRSVAADDHSVFDPNQEVALEQELRKPGNFDFPVHRENGILLARVVARSRDGKLLLIKYKDYDDSNPEEETTYALILDSKTQPTSAKNVIRHEGGNDFEGYAVVDDTGHIATWITYNKAAEEMLTNAAHKGLLQFGNKNKGAFLGFKASSADGTYRTSK